MAVSTQGEKHSNRPIASPWCCIISEGKAEVTAYALYYGPSFKHFLPWLGTHSKMLVFLHVLRSVLWSRTEIWIDIGEYEPGNIGNESGS